MTAEATLDLVRASGVVLTLTGDGIHFEPPRDGIPRTLLDRLRTYKEDVRALLIAEQSRPLTRLTRGGKLCRRCFTISRCRAYVNGFICDPCRRDDDQPATSAAPFTAALASELVADPETDAILAYAS